LQQKKGQHMKTRKPAWAGQFYPNSKDDLQRMLDAFFQNTEKVTGEVLGLVAPHAGYIYSGQTAAHAYKQVQGQHPNKVVVLAPSHAAYIQGVSFFDGDRYETAFGSIEVDRQMIEKITAADPRLHMSPEGHTSGGPRAEHSLEVQLPFLQYVLPDFKLIPAVFHDYSWQTCDALAQTLADHLDSKTTLIVASSDFYHGESYDECHQQDKAAIDAICDGDAERFCREQNEHHYMACGAGPIAVLMAVAKKWHSSTTRLVDHTTSADVMQNFGGYVVGYSAIVCEQ